MDVMDGKSSSVCKRMLIMKGKNKETSVYNSRQTQQ